MEARRATHPSADALKAFGLGQLDDSAAEVVMRHLDLCEGCRKEVAALSDDDFLARLREARGHSSTPFPSNTFSDSAVGRKPPLPPPSSQTAIPNLPAELAASPQYEVLKELGRGGMGVVYLARNKLMDRLEVLKVVNKALLDRPGAVERFLREIRSAAKLRHPNVVAAYSALQLGDLLAFAMEHVEGEDLAALVKSRGPLPVQHACYYAQQAALGLQHAFEKQMVHRDIKPQNLMLTREGKKHVVKVLDFGLAKVKSEKAEDTGLTGEGKMLGTPDYIAPEQTLDAARADIRADVYSLGCTLYFLLTGAAPFKGRSLYEILQAHHSMEARPLNLARPEVPEELAAVVRKMMAKEPAQRYQTPAEVAQALGVFARQGAKGAAAPKSPELSAGVPEARPARPPAPAAEEPKRKAAETAAPPVAWDALTEESIISAEPRKSGAAHKRRPPAAKPSRRMWFIGGGIAAGLLLLGLLGLLAAVVFKMKVKTAEGEAFIVLEVDQPGAEVSVDGGKITVHVPGDNKPVEIQVKPGQHKLRISKDGFVAETKEIELTAGKSPPIKVKLVPVTVAQGGPPEKVEDARPERGEGRASTSFFNGEDLAGWEGLAGYWDVKPGVWDVKDVAIVGRTPPGRPAHTFLVSRKKYRDFDLKFEARRLDGVGNSGVQFRSQLKDPDRYTVVGPQVEIDSINFAFPPGSLVTEPNLDPLQVKPSPDALAELRKTYADDGFNSFHIRCVGKHVTIRVNGVTTVDGDFLSLPEEGVIAWQLHGRMSPKEVTFRKIQFTDLSAAAGAPGAADKNPVVVMKTSLGTIKIELYPDKAPKTVKNFLDYVDARFYDGTIFHRVIPALVIQGGGVEAGQAPDALKKAGPEIENESANGLSNKRGTIAMARTIPRPDSATSQFYINVKDNDFFDRANAQDKVGYCVFGKVIEGMDTVDKIKVVETRTVGAHQNVPVKDVVIESVRRVNK